MAASLQAKATVASKGQVTLPIAVRRALGIKTGDRLRFETKGGEVRLRVERDQSPFLAYQGIGNPGIPSGRKQVVAWVRGLREP